MKSRDFVAFVSAYEELCKQYGVRLGLVLGGRAMGLLRTTNPVALEQHVQELRLEADVQARLFELDDVEAASDAADDYGSSDDLFF